MPGAVRGHDRCQGSITYTMVCTDEDGETYEVEVTQSCGSEYPCCSPNVYVNYRKSVHLGCAGCDGFCRPVKGSPNVFVNGFPKHRRGDPCTLEIYVDSDCDGVNDQPVCCNGIAMTASPNVCVNGAC